MSVPPGNGIECFALFWQSSALYAWHVNGDNGSGAAPLYTWLARLGSLQTNQVITHTRIGAATA